MDVSDEEFWAALRDAVRQARESEASELEEAERLLAETEDVGDDRLSEERIAAMVERAVAAEPQRADVDRPGAEPPPPKAPLIRLGGRSSLLAAAAAVLVAPSFLIAATAVTVVAVSAYLLRNTTDTLSYASAIEIMLDEGESDAHRDAAQGRAYLNVVESITLLRRIAGENAALVGSAGSALAQLSAALADDEPFVRRSFDESWESLAGRVAADQFQPDERDQSLADLVEQVGYAIRALKSLRRGDGPLDQTDKTDARLIVIARSLQ